MLPSKDTARELLGLDKEWAVRAIKAVGNYGEIFERNVGPKSPLGLPRGLNNLLVAVISAGTGPGRSGSVSTTSIRSAIEWISGSDRLSSPRFALKRVPLFGLQLGWTSGWLASILRRG